MLNLAENDPIKEKNYLYLTAFEFHRWYQEYRKEYQRRKEEIEAMKLGKP